MITVQHCTALQWDVPKSVKVIHSLYRFVGTYDLTRKKWRKFGTYICNHECFQDPYSFFWERKFFAICKYLIWLSSKTDVFRYGQNDDEINSTSEYSRSSSDVLNWNSKQKKKRYTFFTFLQSDFKLIELGT